MQKKSPFHKKRGFFAEKSAKKENENERGLIHRHFVCLESL